jgi:hypothetical protein
MRIGHHYAVLGDPVTFFQRHCQKEWWTSTIQSYAQLRLALMGEGLHSHHLLPKSLFENGPRKTQGLINYIPSVPFSQSEHLRTLHSALNDFLRSKGVWQQHLFQSDLERAMELTAQFYEHSGLNHFAAAIRAFRNQAYDKVK